MYMYMYVIKYKANKGVVVVCCCCCCYSIDTQLTSNQCHDQHLVDIVTDIYMSQNSWWYIETSPILPWHFAEMYISWYNDWYIRRYILTNKLVSLHCFNGPSYRWRIIFLYRVPWPIYRSKCWSLLNQIMTDIYQSLVKNNSLDMLLSYPVNVSVEAHWLTMDSPCQWVSAVVNPCLTIDWYRTDSWLIYYW